jgi:prepilin-type N-terminal cleavage/methylation domain-containing protein
MILNKIKSNRKGRGFTIVELLVVIVVIGILAAITIVSYSGITARATTQSNKSNASSVVSAAMVVYANTGVMPIPSSTSATNYTNLNASDAKVPSGFTITNTGAPSGTTITFRVKSTDGVCAGYFDSTGAGAQYILGGTATTDNGTTCS